MAEKRPSSKNTPPSVEASLAELLPELRSFVRLRMGPALRARESASDLVQSTCREILEHQDRYQDRGSNRFRYWLFTEALRKIRNRLDYYQAARRRPRGEIRSLRKDSEGDDQALVSIYRAFSSPSRRMIAREEIERLEAAFEKLPDRYREVITLAKIVGLSHKEIGEAIGRTELASRSLLHRALADLAELLSDD
jgi:RNA polymerase sigma-70 factor (ECF subfamily)